jgi:hypothetical protein
MKLSPANRKRVVPIKPNMGAPAKKYTLPSAPAAAEQAARKALRDNRPSVEYDSR